MAHKPRTLAGLAVMARAFTLHHAEQWEPDADEGPTSPGIHGGGVRDCWRGAGAARRRSGGLSHEKIRTQIASPYDAMVRYRLILLCVGVGKSIGGMSGSFAIDPTGNNDFAETVDGPLWNERARTLASLSTLRAKRRPGFPPRHASYRFSLTIERAVN
jgi:hypothetical protein